MKDLKPIIYKQMYVIAYEKKNRSNFGMFFIREEKRTELRLNV